MFLLLFLFLFLSTSNAIQITGTRSGNVYGGLGLAIYALDSDLSTAAVHAGLLQEGETAEITVHRIGLVQSLAGLTRNGVIGLSRQFPCEAVLLSRGGCVMGTAAAVHVVGDSSPYAGNVWGSDRYTIYSSIARAVVHAGVLVNGQDGIVVISVLGEATMNISGSSRNDVFTLDVVGGVGECVFTFSANRAVSFNVTGGNSSGQVYGGIRNIYAWSSDLSAAAVHAGLLAVNETKVLDAFFLGVLGSFSAGGVQNEISSLALEKANHSILLSVWNECPKSNLTASFRVIGSSPFLGKSVSGNNPYRLNSVVSGAAVESSLCTLGSSCIVNVLLVGEIDEWNESAENYSSNCGYAVVAFTSFSVTGPAVQSTCYGGVAGFYGDVMDRPSRMNNWQPRIISGTDWNSAAKHAGFVSRGKSDIVCLYSVFGIADFESSPASLKNGVYCSVVGRLPHSFLVWKYYALRSFSSCLSDRIFVYITGSTVSRNVWGSGPYTLFSNMGAAAVHAGLLSVGETRLIMIQYVGLVSRFVSSNPNGRGLSLNYSFNECGFVFSDFKEPMLINLTGQSSGDLVYEGSSGAGLYYWLSDWSAAVVHAGLLLNGETRTVSVFYVGKLDRFLTRSQFGVSSSLSTAQLDAVMFSLNDGTCPQASGYVYVSGALRPDSLLVGSNPYALPSFIAQSALHAGMVQLASTNKRQGIVFFGPRDRSFVGSLGANGTLTSLSLNASACAFSFLRSNRSDIYSFMVKGRTSGLIFGGQGSDFVRMYSIDSDLGTAAVHAGLLGVNESGSITAYFVGEVSSLPSVNRNGITFYLDLAYLLTEPFRYGFLRTLMSIFLFLPPIFISAYRVVCSSKTFQLTSLTFAKWFRMALKLTAFENVFERNDHVPKLLIYVIYNFFRLCVFLCFIIPYHIFMATLFTLFLAYIAIANLHFFCFHYLTLLCKLYLHRTSQAILLQFQSQKSYRAILFLLCRIDASLRCLPSAIIISLNIYYTEKRSIFVIMKLVLSSLLLFMHMLSSKFYKEKASFNHSYATSIETNITTGQVLNQATELESLAFAGHKSSEFDECDNNVQADEISNRIELLRKLLNEVADLQKKQIISQGEAYNLCTAIEVLEDNQLRELYSSYIVQKAKPNDECNLAAIFRRFISFQINNHLSEIKLRFLTYLDSIQTQGHILAGECDSIRNQLALLTEQQLFTKLCFFESAFEILSSPEEVADEIKSIFFIQESIELTNTSQLIAFNKKILKKSSSDLNKSEAILAKQSKILQAKISLSDKEADNLSGQKTFEEREKCSESVDFSHESESAHECEIKSSQGKLNITEVFNPQTFNAPDTPNRNPKRASQAGNVKELLKLFSR